MIVNEGEEGPIDLSERYNYEIIQSAVLYSEYVKRKITEGIETAEDGRVLSHDEVKRLFGNE